MGDISTHFDRREFECGCGCGGNTVDVDLVEILEKIRHHFNKPIKINSGFRCPVHNSNINGSPTSQHLKGKAADIVVKDTDVNKVHEYACKILNNHGGVGKYDTFTHVDCRQKLARW